MTGNPSLSRCLVCFDDGMAVINSYIAAASREHRNLKIETLRPIFQRRINNWTMPPPFPTHRMLSIDFFVGTAAEAAAQVSKHGGLVVTHPQFLILAANGQWLARERCSSKEKPCMIFTDKSFLRKQANDFANGISTHL